MATEINHDAAISDWAIVVGIARYPALGNGATPSNLVGPALDAWEVASWLVTDVGVPHDRLICITSDGKHDLATGVVAAWPPSEVHPNREDIERPLYHLARKGLIDRNTGPGRIGRRLWLYGAGHGFAPSVDPDDVGFLAADALDLGYVPNLALKKYADWFAQLGLFDEVVLWLDCCTTKLPGIPVGTPLQQQIDVASGLAKRFYVKAAQADRKAYEDTTQGPPHGIFTSRLLHALRGGVPLSATGHVTSEAIDNFFRNQQLPATSNPAEQQRPKAIVADLIDLVHISSGDGLATIASTAPIYSIQLGLAAGIEVDVIDWNLRTVAKPTVAADGAISAALAAGVYKINGPDDTRLFFQIVSGSPSVMHIDPAVQPIPKKAQQTAGSLRITLTSDRDAEAYIVGGDLQLVASHPGEVTTDSDQAPGLYKLKVVRAQKLAERLIEFPVDGNSFDLRAASLETLLPNGADSGEKMGHIESFMASLGPNEGPVPGVHPGTDVVAELAAPPTTVDGKRPAKRRKIADRYKSEMVLAAATDAGLPPWIPAVQILPYGPLDASVPNDNNLLDRTRIREMTLDDKYLRAASTDLRAGFCRVIGTVANKRIQMVLPLLAGRQTRVFARLRRAAGATNGDPSDWADLAVQMVRPGESFFVSKGNDHADVIRSALAQGRRIIVSGVPVLEMLEAKYTDPLVGIAGAHLMLAALERDEAAKASLAKGEKPAVSVTPSFTRNDIGKVLRNMAREDVLGRHADLNHHAQVLPDIVALYVRAGLLERRLQRVSRPPLFWESWRWLLTDGGQHAVLDQDLRNAAARAFAWGPYLVFSLPETHPSNVSPPR